MATTISAFAATGTAVVSGVLGQLGQDFLQGQNALANEFKNVDTGANLGPLNVAGNFSYDVFPSDVGADYNGHFMVITAIDGGRPTGVGGNVVSPFLGLPGVSNTAEYASVLFIPGGVSGSGIVYHDAHEYTDIKLTNVIRDKIGASAGPLQSITGVAMNPGVQVLYRSTGLRSFQFQFLMAPESERESRSMESIIKHLRYYAAPRAQGMLFETPAEFEIRFYNKGEENTHIPKIRRCVLNHIDVDYTPLSGEWSTFTNGYPVAALMSLNFQEMEIIHKDFIAGGN